MKALRKVGIKVKRQVSLSTMFPLAKLHGPISSELTEMWEMRRCARQRQKDSQSTPPLYETVLLNGCSVHQYMTIWCF